MRIFDGREQKKRMKIVNIKAQKLKKIFILATLWFPLFPY